MINTVPLQIMLRSLTRVPLVSVRGFVNRATDEYRQRMRAHLNRAERQQVLSVLEELVQTHGIQPHTDHYLLAMRAITSARQKPEAERLYALVQRDVSTMDEIAIRRGLVYMFAVVVGDLARAETLVATAPTPHISIYATLMTVRKSYRYFRAKYSLP